MKIVINVHGGVVQDVYVDDPAIQVILVDWDNDASEPDEDPCLVRIDAAGGRLARSILYPTTLLDEMPADMQEAVAKAAS